MQDIWSKSLRGGSGSNHRLRWEGKMLHLLLLA
jgi:hypothetical protein